MGEGKYVYGVINFREGLNFELAQDSQISEQIYVTPYKDIVAVVSNSELIDCHQMPRDALARLLVKHQTVIERIMRQGHQVVPVKLGTWAEDQSEVRYILNKGYSLIKDTMEQTVNKIEIDVVATWSDSTSILEEVGQEKKVKEIKEKLLANPKGVDVDDQMKVGAMVKEALDKKREQYASFIQDSLKSVIQDFRVHELMDNQMVTNTAFLIKRDDSGDFDEMIEKLNVKFAEKVNFRCVGPLPPYSFYTLEVKKLQFKQIDWARKKLSLLNDFTSKDGIKKAYLKTALSTHPDRKLNYKPGIEKVFNDTTKAYKLLVDYCLAVEQSQQQAKVFFKEDEFRKNSILIKLMGKEFVEAIEL